MRAPGGHASVEGLKFAGLAPMYRRTGPTRSWPGTKQTNVIKEMNACP
jgi:hypothetical protein